MNWYTLKNEFMRKFPHWSVVISPPCISDVRYTHYYYEALAYILGKKEHCLGCVVKDETNKRFILYR